MSTNDDLTFIPKNAPDRIKDDVRDALGTEIVELSIYDSSLIGLFSAINKNGAILPKIAYSKEVEKVSEYLDVVIIDEFTAIGNLVATNDRTAILSPVIPDKYIDEIRNKLKVDVERFSANKMDVTGSLVVMTNKGFIASSMIPENKIHELEDILGIEGKASTLNYGIPFIGPSLVANDNGAIVGGMSTPLEVGAIDEMLLR